MTDAAGTSDRPAVVILGAGRAGCSLHAALGSAGYDVRLWTRSAHTAEAARAEGFDVVVGDPCDAISDVGSDVTTDVTTEASADDFSQVSGDVIDDVAALTAPATVVVLAVSDPAVAPVAERLARSGVVRPGRVFVHLAGSLDLSPLEPLRAAGAAVGSLHPLASLASRRSSLRGFAAAIAASDADTHALLSSLADDAGLLPYSAPADRAKHHAACCIVGNFPQVLLEAAQRVLTSEGLDADTARRALGPLLVGAAHNALEKGPAPGLTGPVSRGDATTVARHLEAVSGIPGVAPLYRSASRIAVDLARTNGVDASAVARLLDGDDGDDGGDGSDDDRDDGD